MNRFEKLERTKQILTDIIELRTTSVLDLVVRARQSGKSDFSFLSGDDKVASAHELAEMLVHGFFVMSDVEKDELCEVIQSTKSKR